MAISLFFWTIKDLHQVWYAHDHNEQAQAGNTAVVLHKGMIISILASLDYRRLERFDLTGNHLGNVHPGPILGLCTRNEELFGIKSDSLVRLSDSGESVEEVLIGGGEVGLNSQEIRPDGFLLGSEDGYRHVPFAIGYEEPED